MLGSYLGVTLDDREQSLVDGQKRRPVDPRAQVFERRRLERRQHHGHVMRAGEEPLPLAEQRRHRRDGRDGEGEGERRVPAGPTHEELPSREHGQKL